LASTGKAVILGKIFPYLKQKRTKVLNFVLFVKKYKELFAQYKN